MRFFTIFYFVSNGMRNSRIQNQLTSKRFIKKKIAKKFPDLYLRNAFMNLYEPMEKFLEVRSPVASQKFKKVQK